MSTDIPLKIMCQMLDLKFIVLWWYSLLSLCINQLEASTFSPPLPWSGNFIFWRWVCSNSAHQEKILFKYPYKFCKGKISYCNALQIDQAPKPFLLSCFLMKVGYLPWLACYIEPLTLAFHQQDPSLLVQISYPSQARFKFFTHPPPPGMDDGQVCMGRGGRELLKLQFDGCISKSTL